MKKLYYLFLLTIFVPLNVYANEAINISNGATYKLNENSVTKLKDNNVKTNRNNSNIFLIPSLVFLFPK